MNNKIKALCIHLSALALFATGCSTPPKVYVGAGIGAAAGAALGHNAGGGTDESRIVGALIGAGIGSLIAYSAGQKSESASSKGPDKSLEETFPALSKPKLRSVWVPDKIEGNQYIKGHYIYIIEDPGTWSRQP
jgi:hypothetical protein